MSKTNKDTLTWLRMDKSLSMEDLKEEEITVHHTIHVLYFWKALATRNSMAMSWGVRHANTQRQRQRQRQIHLGPEVESHYRPYMCYIFGKPWVQGPL